MVARKTLAVALVLLPLLVAGLATYWVYGQPHAAYVDFERGYEDGFVSGFHAPERPYFDALLHNLLGSDVRGLPRRGGAFSGLRESLAHRSGSRRNVLCSLAVRGDRSPHRHRSHDGEPASGRGSKRFGWGAFSPECTRLRPVHDSTGVRLPPVRAGRRGLGSDGSAG